MIQDRITWKQRKLNLYKMGCKPTPPQMLSFSLPARILTVKAAHKAEVHTHLNSITGANSILRSAGRPGM